MTGPQRALLNQGIIAARAAGARVVQCRADRDTGLDSAEVQRRAAAGVSSGGGPLPYLDTLQRAFGGHDLSGVQAHTATDAATAIGARAYTMGEHVAFGGPPDLHTAAHEAAHVVQQRGGVSVPGGVGRAGDAWERHADAVADAVVSGGSAEALLGAAGSSVASSAASPSVQRETPDDETIRREVEQAAQVDGDDDYVRETIRAAHLQVAAPQQKAQMIVNLLDGFTGDEDEEMILTILRCPDASATLTALQSMGHLEWLFDDMHGEEYDQLLQIDAPQIRARRAEEEGTPLPSPEQAAPGTPPDPAAAAASTPAAETDRATGGGPAPANPVTPEEPSPDDPSGAYEIVFGPPENKNSEVRAGSVQDCKKRCDQLSRQQSSRTPGFLCVQLVRTSAVRPTVDPSKRVTGLKLRYKHIITIPMWVDLESNRGGWHPLAQEAWDTAKKGMVQHEDEHVRLDLDIVTGRNLKETVDQVPERDLSAKLDNLIQKADDAADFWDDKSQNGTFAVPPQTESTSIRIPHGGTVDDWNAAHPDDAKKKL
jgi:hypothetical protein